MKGMPILIAVALVAAGSLAGCVRTTDTGTGTVTRVDVDSTPQQVAAETVGNRTADKDVSVQAPATAGK
jgi:hypothetical protein